MSAAMDLIAQLDVTVEASYSGILEPVFSKEGTAGRGTVGSHGGSTPVMVMGSRQLGRDRLPRPVLSTKQALL